MTRGQAIKMWLVAGTMVVVAAIAIGVDLTIGRAATLLLLCLVPALVAIFVWPGVPPPAVSDSGASRDRRR